MIAFIGPLPPPLGGFSHVTKQVFQKLLSMQATVEVFDRSIRPTTSTKGSYTLTVIVTSLRLILNFFQLSVAGKVQCLYVALSGGKGQAIDCVFICIAKVAAIPIYVHHHSFSYINKPNIFYRITFSTFRRSRHIVLCDKMGRHLAEIYKVPNSNIICIPNGAYYEKLKDINSAATSETCTRFGFLSNITRAKGIFTFFDILAEFSKRGAAVSGIVAGPVSDEIRQEFDTRCFETGSSYFGPVAGVSKDSFYRSIDIFIFPSEYKNEAEPLVIVEAMAYRRFIVAADVGCIASMLQHYPLGRVVPAGAGGSQYVKAIQSILATNFDANALLDEYFKRAEGLLADLCKRIISSDTGTTG